MTDALQRNNTYHIDIKSDNILIQFKNGSPYPVLIDFGLAMFGESDSTEEPVYWGNNIENYPHMAPELAELSSPISTTDLYSVMALCKLVGQIAGMADMEAVADNYCSHPWKTRPSHDNI